MTIYPKENIKIGSPKSSRHKGLKPITNKQMFFYSLGISAVLGLGLKLGTDLSQYKDCSDYKSISGQVDACSKQVVDTLDAGEDDRNKSKKDIWDTDIPGNMHGMPTGAPY